MKRHLTERELIEYQFKLADQNRAQEIDEHLAECSDCRERLERLKHKFTALDLLPGRIKASEELVSKVAQQVRQPVPATIFPFRRSAQIAAAAAVLVVAVLILMPLSKKAPRVSELEVAKRPAGPAIEERFDLKTEIADAAKKTPATRAVSSSVEVERLGKSDESAMAGIAAAKPVAEAIPEQPPFAPASAIELVTLPKRDKVQITIYNSADLTLVRERRNLTLKRGWNWLQFMWSNTLIDPTSLNLEPLKHADKIDIEQLVFPARLRELGRWLIRSEITGQVPFEITYFTSGLSWRVFYMGTLSADEKKMKLQGYVRVANDSGEDYENAQTRLIVGKVHLLDRITELAKRQYPYDRPSYGLYYGYDYGGFVDREDRKKVRLLGEGLGAVAGLLEDADKFERKEVKKEGLSEYFLYTIEGTETIADKWGKRLVSFEAEDVPVKSLYKYDEERWGRQTIRYVAFANDEEHNLGDTPIPNGAVKIYSRADNQGHLSYIGGTNVKYIPVDEEVELNLGPARLVSVEPTLSDFKTDNFVFDKKDNIAGWDEVRTFKIEVTNARELAVQVEITRGFGTAYWRLKADIPYEEHDATHARFNLKVKPRTKRTFGYTVTTYHGLREE